MTFWLVNCPWFGGSRGKARGHVGRIGRTLQVARHSLERIEDIVYLRVRSTIYRSPLVLSWIRPMARMHRDVKLLFWWHVDYPYLSMDLWDWCLILDTKLGFSPIIYKHFHYIFWFPHDFLMILPSFPRFIPFHHVCPQDLAEQERQFHTVTEIVRKHRETAKNKSLGPLEKTKSLLTMEICWWLINYGNLNIIEANGFVWK